MKKLAINIVLLPPDPVMDLVLDWNRMLRKNRVKNITLNKTDYLPHISIVMGCLFADQLEHANTILHSIAAQQKALYLQLLRCKTVGAASEDGIITLDFDLSPELAGFHETIVRAFEPLLTQDATEEVLYDLPPVETSSLSWINEYIPHHCFEHFWPHITLGFGLPPENFRPYSFQASRLAICHLGNHCTCRKILGEVFLKAR